MNLEHMADYLCNSLEHETSNGHALESLMDLELSAKQALNLLHKWNNIGPKERLEMSESEVMALVEDAIKITY